MSHVTHDICLTDLRRPNGDSGGLLGMHQKNVSERVVEELIAFHCEPYTDEVDWFAASYIWILVCQLPRANTQSVH
jgi:hypothetical protein